jgi:hypothetical protein
MSASAKPDSVEQGRPVTLTVRLSGNPIEGVAGPNLSVHPELASRFDFTHEEMLGEVDRGSKIFRRAIFPKQPGEQTIPSIRWSYFDPSDEAYHTLTTEPIALRVDPSSSGPELANVNVGHDTLTQPTTLTLLSGGLSPNYVDPDLVLANQTVSLGPVATGVLAAAPVAWLVITIACRRRAKLRSDQGLARRRRARQRALKRLAAAMKSAGEREQLAKLASALTAYVADRLNLPPAQVTPAEARAALTTIGVEEPVVRDIVSFLDACDAASYAPTTLDSISPAQAADQMKTWIATVERASR